MRGQVETLRNNIWKEVAVVMLAATSVVLLIFELSADLLAEQVAAIRAADLLISLVFLTDFLIGLWMARSRTQYIRQNWPDLLASIPITEGVFQTLRALRLLRIVRVVRVAARMRRIAILSDRLIDQSSTYIYATVITSVVILTGAVSFHSVEIDVNPEVHDLFDAVWWAVVTTSTVGYGDVYPVTIEGRLIGMALMFFGIGLVGTIAGFVGSYFLSKKVALSRKP